MLKPVFCSVAPQYLGSPAARLEARPGPVVYSIVNRNDAGLIPTALMT
jgi:hypothetical protein